MTPLFLHSDEIGPDKGWVNVTEKVMRSIWDRSLSDVDPQVIWLMDQETKPKWLKR
jgi:hypothetical protein